MRWMGKRQAPHAALFHNNHDGTFTNVAEKAGVTNDRWGVGVAVGDYDNDGWPDMYVTNVGKNRLYHNNHDGTFTDVAEKAGVALGTWSTGPTFGDYDGDGSLDLFVPGYTAIRFQRSSGSGFKMRLFRTICQYRGVSVFCGPRGLKGEHDHLFHNNGDGTFTDVSVKAGVADAPGYYGLVSLFVDLNGDGKPELLVANDSTPNYLYRNKGDGTFEDLSFESGYAVNRDGRETASMGIAVGDYQNNGRLDILNTDFLRRLQSALPEQRRPGVHRCELRVRHRERRPFRFSAGAMDSSTTTTMAGRISSLPAGTSIQQVDQAGLGHQLRAASAASSEQLQWEKFELVPAVEGTGLAVVVSARGAAFGDLFNDGNIDVGAEQYRRVADALAQRKCGSSSLDRVPAHRRNGQATRCGWRVYLSEDGKNHATWRRVERRQFRLFQRSASPLRTRETQPRSTQSKFIGRAAGRRKRSMFMVSIASSR